MNTPTSNTSDKLRKPLVALVISSALVLGVSKHEGFKENAYRPLPNDILSLGHGSTRHPDGSPIKATDTITRKQAEDYLKHDLSKFSNQISKCIKVPVSQYEYEAYVSLTYNIGAGAFCSSTLVRKLNRYDYEGACKEILRWNKFQGQEVRGLTNRRQQEYDLCIKK
jgi:lysozyme